MLEKRRGICRVRVREHVSCQGALPSSSEGLWWGVMEEKVLRDPAQAQAVVVAVERCRIRQWGLAPGTCKNGGKVTED